MNAGVDMVYLNLKPDQYRVSDVSQFNHRRPALPYGQEPEVWGVSGSGQPLTGTLFVNRGSGGYDATIQVDNRGLHVQFNPSKMVHPYELTADIRSQAERVKSLVNELRIDADLNTATLSRIDLAKQAVMTQPVSSFAQAFSALRGRRVKKRIQYPDGYEVGNKSRYVVFYDKAKELSESGVTGAPENLLRCECRYTGKAVGNTRTGIGIGTLNDLVKVDPDYLTDRYNYYLLTDVFRASDGHQLAINYEVEDQILDSFLSAHGQPANAVTQYRLMCGEDPVFSVWGGIDNFVDQLRRKGVARQTADRIKNNLHRQLDTKRMIDRRRNKDKGLTHDLDTLIRTFAA